MCFHNNWPKRRNNLKHKFCTFFQLRNVWVQIKNATNNFKWFNCLIKVKETEPKSVFFVLEVNKLNALRCFNRKKKVGDINKFSIILLSICPFFSWNETYNYNIGRQLNRQTSILFNQNWRDSKKSKIVHILPLFLSYIIPMMQAVF